MISKAPYGAPRSTESQNPRNKKGIQKTLKYWRIPKSKRYFPKSKHYLPKSKRYLPKSKHYLPKSKCYLPPKSER